MSGIERDLFGRIIKKLHIEQPQLIDFVIALTRRVQEGIETRGTLFWRKPSFDELRGELEEKIEEWEIHTQRGAKGDINNWLDWEKDKLAFIAVSCFFLFTQINEYLEKEGG